VGEHYEPFAQASEPAWTLVSEKPLAFGGWRWVLGCEDRTKTLAWFPGPDAALLEEIGRNVRGIGRPAGTDKAAKKAVADLLAALNASSANCDDVPIGGAS
jgi:hypothetical protein